VRLRAYGKPLVVLVFLLVLLLTLLLGSLRALSPRAEGTDAASTGGHAEGCRPGEGQKRSWNGTLGVAADASGRFSLYGLPDAEDGRRTEDSYDVVLLSCSVAARGALPPRGGVSVHVSGERAQAAYGDGVLEPTRTAPDGSLVTRHLLAGGVSFEQRLSLDGEDLEVSYRLTNLSESRRRVSVRSVLTPPVAGNRGPHFVAPGAYNEGTGRELGLAVGEERMLPAAEVGPVEVPRPGAASDSGGRWGSSSWPAPDALVFAATGRLLSAPFVYAPGGRRLPASSSMAAYWLGERIPPGGTIRVSWRYETPSAIPPGQAPSRTVGRNR